MARGTPTLEIDAILHGIGARQLGLVTHDQAVRAGVDRWALLRRRRAGSLAPVFAGVERLTSAPVTAEQRILAAALAVPRSIIAATSAAIVHGMPLGPVGTEPIVCVSANRSARTTGIVIVRSSFALPRQRWQSAAVATPAASLLLLPRFVGPGVVERCLDYCLAHRLVTPTNLRRLLDDVPPRALVGRRLLMDLVHVRTGGPAFRSGLERRVARWLDHAGLVGWRSNYPVPVGNGRTLLNPAPRSCALGGAGRTTAHGTSWNPPIGA